MAKRKLTDPFAKLEKANNDFEDKQETILRNTNTEYNNAIQVSDTNTNDSSYNKKQNNNDNYLIDEDSSSNVNNNKLNNKKKNSKDNKDDNSEMRFLELYEEKSKKLTIEETHTRRSYLIRNDLEEEMQRHAKKKKRGFMTLFVNYAIEQALKELDKK